MKKSLYFVALAALMASCANEESVQVGTPSNAIGFNTYVGKTTKAGDVTTSNLSSFYVYGGFADAPLVFDAVEVTSSDAGWTYNGTQYWVPEKVYTFAAVSPAVDASYDLSTLTIEGYVAGKDDLIVATTGTYTGKESDNDPVALNFKHALAKVQFTFGNKYADIENVKVKGVNSVGDLTATYGTGVEFEWDNVGTPNTYSYSDALYLIPQEVKEGMVLSFTQGSINYDVELTSANLDKWEAGKVYNYTLDLSEGQERFKFNVTEPEWESPSNNTLGEPSVNDGYINKITTIEPIADLQVRNNGEIKNVVNMEINNNVSQNVLIRGLMKFTLPENLDEDAIIEKAELRLVTAQLKGDKKVNIYNFGIDFTESSTYDELSSTIESSVSGEAITYFEANGQGNAALGGTNSGTDYLATDYRTVEAWTNYIDLKEFIEKQIEADASFISILLAKEKEENNAIKIFTKEATETTSNFKDEVGTVTFAAKDLVPQLTITYKYKSED